MTAGISLMKEKTGGNRPPLQSDRRRVLNPPPERLTYLDWMRGLAALIMLQGHAFDRWLRTDFRNGALFDLSQVFGGFPAPIFLFLVGASMAIVVDRLRRKRPSASGMLLRIAKRGGWILLLAYVFRIEQYLVWYPASDWLGVFRIDTLNCIGISMLLVGAFSIPFRTSRAKIAVMASTAAIVVIITPWVFSIKTLLPSIALDYINGHGHPEYFSIFSWSAFAFAGAAFGYAALEARLRGAEDLFFYWVATAGIVAYAAGQAMTVFPIFEYGSFDYSLTSPAFFLLRIGCVLIILYMAYRWSHRRVAPRWSPLRTLGQSSLLVYWLHMDLVYGRPFNALGRGLDNKGVLLQLAWLVPSMLALSALRQYGFSRAVRQLWNTVAAFPSSQRRGGRDINKNIAKLPLMERTGWSDRRSQVAPN